MITETQRHSTQDLMSLIQSWMRKADVIADGWHFDRTGMAVGDEAVVHGYGRYRRGRIRAIDGDDVYVEFTTAGALHVAQHYRSDSGTARVTCRRDRMHRIAVRPPHP